MIPFRQGAPVLVTSALLLFALAAEPAAAQQRTQALQSKAAQFEADYVLERARADAAARRLGMPIRKVYPDGRIIEIQGLDERGLPYYYTTHNAVSAQTIAVDRVHPGGADGLALTGEGETLGIWDGGGVRTTHQELVGRVTQIDGASGVSGHATLVSGTMIAAGVNADARGMSFEALLDAHDWNNALSEMATAASGGLKVSNHSYGLVAGWGGRQECGGEERPSWHGNPNISETEDHRFGFYNNGARNVDDLARTAPHYLIVQSGGNDRGDNGSTTHCIRSGGGWVVSSVNRPRDGGSDGFDSVSGRAVAKNNLTIGAIQDIPGGYTNPSDVRLTGFSAFGPTDDGRIKPDLVANGAGLLSSAGGGDAAYNSASGTSLSAPSAAGGIGLLQQHHRLLNGDNPLRASTIKALLIQTADEAGSANGPDYAHGWGLINISRAAALMTLDANLGGGVLQELMLDDGAAIEIPVDVTESDHSLRATIAWTDIPGTPTPASLDPATPMLVNDLDLEIIGPNGTHMPWILDPANPSAAATTGDNARDNVEQVVVYDPVPGEYRIRISHKDLLSGGAQPVSLVLDRGPGPTYAISGRVVLESDPSTGGGSVDVRLSGLIDKLTTTDAEGYFRFDGLYEGEYVVTPSLGGVSFSPDSQSVTLEAGDLEGIEFRAQTSGRRLVTLQLNTSTIPDTLSASADIRITGCLDDCAQASYLLPDGQTLAADASASIRMSHTGGDYWEAAFEIPEQTSVEFAFAVNDGDPQYLTEAGGNHVIDPGIGDLVLPLHYFEFSEDEPYDWRPWEPLQDHIAVQFRAYFPPAFSPIIVGVRGDEIAGEGPLRWDQPRLTLLRESQDDTTVGFRLFSGVAYYPKTLADSTQSYRVRLEVLDWTSADEFTFVVPENDTTLQWVLADNGLPVAADDEVSVDEDAEVEIDVVSNDSDPDGELIRVVDASAGEFGQTVVRDVHLIDYIPNEDFNGTDTFTYTLSDDRGARTEGRVTVTVQPVNDPPIAGDITDPAFGDTILVQGDPNDVLTVVWDAASDIDEDELTYTWELATDQAFDDVLLTVDAGTSTSVDVEFGAIAAALTEAGVELDAMATTSHRVVVTDGSEEDHRSPSRLHLTRGTITSAEDGDEVPKSLTLSGNYPNPFNPSTTIRYGLPAPGEVRLDVYDALGRRVRVLEDGVQTAGWHRARFEASGLPSGVYFYVLRAGAETKTGRMILLQ